MTKHRIKHGFTYAVLVGFLIAGLGCTTSNNALDDLDPEVSQPTYDYGAMPEFRPEGVTSDVYHSKVPKNPSDPASLWKNTARNLFLDQRAANVGDILTVVIDINDQAQLNNSSKNSRSGSTEADAPVFLGYGSKTGASADEKIVNLGSTSSASGDGSIKRKEAIELKVAATIVRILGSGNLVVVGKQEVKVNSELRELSVTGIIRPEDIGNNNTISYEKIAEARITYGGRGQISVVQKPRVGHALVDILFPY